MQILKFLFSSEFHKQLFKMAIALMVLFVVITMFLNVITHHNDYQKVPDLQGVLLNDLEAILEDQQLRYEVLDSARFVPDLPPFSILSHSPSAGSEVKKNRKIYLTVNPSGYGKVTVPNLIQITKRNAESMLKAVGFELGKITYKDNLGKDMVLEILHDGKTISAGTLLPKTSKIDLVLGNGKR